MILKLCIKVLPVHPVRTSRNRQDRDPCGIDQAGLEEDWNIQDRGGSSQQHCHRSACQTASGARSCQPADQAVRAHQDR
jgi:hypothetical protein